MTQAQQLHPQGTAEDEVTSQFYIPAVSSLQERRLRALKHGDSFALFNHYGDIVPFRGAPDGTLSLRHPLPVASRIAPERPAAAAAELDGS